MLHRGLGGALAVRSGSGSSPSAKNGSKNPVQYHGRVSRPSSRLWVRSSSLGLGVFVSSLLVASATAQPSPASAAAPAAQGTASARAAAAKDAPGKPQGAGPGKASVGTAKPAAKPAKKTAAPEPAAYEVLFTFDDGPRYETTPKVLDTLDQYGIKSVFFVNGTRFMGKGKGPERGRELLRETIRRGHIIGNHTVHHFFLCGKRGPTIAEREITENASLIQDATGKAPELFRTPFGSRCASLSATLKRLNIHPIGWDVDPQDWKLQDADRIFEFMTNALRTLRRPRSILLFHDIHQATVDMLPRLLKWIAEENEQRRVAKRPPIKIIDYSYLLATNPPGAAAPSGPG